MRNGAIANAEFGIRMSEHPKSSSEVKNDWLVVAMHATVGSRSEECGMVLTQIRMSKHPKNTSLGEV